MSAEKSYQDMVKEVLARDTNKMLQGIWALIEEPELPFEVKLGCIEQVKMRLYLKNNLYNLKVSLDKIENGEE